MTAKRMRRRDQRLLMIAAAGALLTLAMTLTLLGMRNAVTFYASPSDLAEKAEPDRRIRIGGLVVAGSVRQEADGAMMFGVTDGATIVQVRYAGVLPDLFRENQGVVAEGTWRPGEAFAADRVLARHDENYMPREVAEALKQRGEWKGASPP